MNNNIQAFGHKIYFNEPDTLRINWNITKYCNYRCPYCYAFITPNNIDKRDVFSNLNCYKIDNIIYNIILNYSQKKEIDLTITGGEPTSDPNFLYIIEQSLRRLHNLTSLRIHTNLYQNINFWEKFSLIYHKENKKNIRFDVEASLHLDYIDNYKILGEFINKLIFLDSANVNINCYIMVNRINYEKAKDYYSIINNQKKNLAKFRLIQDVITGKPDIIDFKDEDNILNNYILYIDNTIEKKSTNDIIRFNSNNFKGMFCLRGLCLIIINPDGFVYFSEQPEVCKNNLLAEKYNFSDKNIRINNLLPFRCQLNKCVHIGDLSMLKLNLDGYKKWLKEKRLYID